MGKTTLVPLALLDAAWLCGTILMLEPRRLATRAAAARMASLLGEPVGQRVGYRTRLDQAVSTATRIEVVTDGLLLRRLQTDPGLDGVAIVILDEIHERGLDSDLALAFCRDLQRTLRPELRLLAMSATADAARLAALLAAETIETAGRLFPVVTRHATRDPGRPARPAATPSPAPYATALDTETGDIPRLPARAWAKSAAPKTPCHGCGRPGPATPRRPPDGRAGPRPSPSPTPAAWCCRPRSQKPSLTVPGVRVVIDGGWRRTPKLDPATGLTRLVTVRISAAAATQRAGRAGREGPGVAIRLWTTALHRSLPAFDQPEIFQAELAGMRLDCAAWGTGPGRTATSRIPPHPARWPPPPPCCKASARSTPPSGSPNSAGAMARLGAPPKAGGDDARHGNTPPQAALAADIAALLEERDPLRSSGQADIALRLCRPARRRTPAPTAPSCRASAARPPNTAAACICRPTRSPPATRPPLLGRRLPRPHSPAPRRTRQLPPVRRWRREAGAMATRSPAPACWPWPPWR